MAELSSPVQKLIQRYRDIFAGVDEEGDGLTVHVDEVASKVAALYEKIRGVVDWKEEHLIRRTAIERVLKRRLISELSGIGLLPGLRAEDIAEPLVLELIRGGHFPNDKIPQAKVAEVQRTLEKYLYIIENNPLNGSFASLKVKERINFFNKILAIAACEIEETLAPPAKEDALIEFMITSMEERIQLPRDVVITPEEKYILTSIAVRQTLFHLDSPLITYRLLNHWYPGWRKFTPDLLGEIAQGIFAILEQAEQMLNHPLAKKFYKACEQQDTLYLLLDDVLSSFADNPGKISEKLAEPQALANLVTGAYRKRLSTLKSRLFRMAIYSTLSIFIGGAFTLFVIEVPLAHLFYGEFSSFAVIVDILAPTALMFLLVATIRPPKGRNRELAIAAIKKLVYEGEGKDMYEVKTSRKRGPGLNFVITVFYALGCCLSLGTIVWLFWLSGIPPTSVFLDTINVAAIAWAGLVVRRRGGELDITEEKTTIIRFLLDMMALPAVKLGNWCMEKWHEYNIVSVFLMVLVDTPFAVFIEFVEGWSSFLKEKKEEIH